MSQGPAGAGFFGPGRFTLGAHFGRVNGDPQLARGSLLKTTPIVYPKAMVHDAEIQVLEDVYQRGNTHITYCTYHIPP